MLKRWNFLKTGFYEGIKIAFDGDGIIVYRDGYGAGDEDRWRDVFEKLGKRN